MGRMCDGNSWQRIKPLVLFAQIFLWIMLPTCARFAVARSAIDQIEPASPKEDAVVAYDDGETWYVVTGPPPPLIRRADSTADVRLPKDHVGGVDTLISVLNWARPSCFVAVCAIGSLISGSLWLSLAMWYRKRVALRRVGLLVLLTVVCEAGLSALGGNALRQLGCGISSIIQAPANVSEALTVGHTPGGVVLGGMMPLPPAVRLVQAGVVTLWWVVVPILFLWQRRRIRSRGIPVSQEA